MKTPADPHAVVWTPGRILCLAAGFSFLALCILTPLAGPAAALTEEASRSGLIFLLTALLTLLLASVAWWRCRREGTPRRAAVGLWLATLLFILLHLAGAFR